MRLYLDACCLSRLTDDQSQARVRREAEAVEAILHWVRDGRVRWVSSVVLEIETSRNPQTERRGDVIALLALAHEVVVPSAATAKRSEFLQTLGFRAFDALHLASAEQGQAAVFVTTDDGLSRRAGRYGSELRVHVQNPLFLYQDVLNEPSRYDE